jgi:hypothetical protein
MLSVRTCAQRCSKSCQLALHIPGTRLSVVLVRLRKRLSGTPQSSLCTLERLRDLGGVINNAPGKSGNAPAPRNDQRTCHQCGKVGHIKRTCPELNSGAIMNARYANAPAKQKGGDLSNVECYTCHKMGHYSNKCPDRQPGTAMGTRQEGKLWCSHHQTNMHGTEECWHLHPHLKDQGGGRKKGKGKQQSNARSAETASSGSSGIPVERSYGRCLLRSCSRRMRLRQVRAEKIRTVAVLLN